MLQCDDDVVAAVAWCCCRLLLIGVVFWCVFGGVNGVGVLVSGVVVVVDVVCVCSLFVACGVCCLPLCVFFFLSSFVVR